MTFDGIGIYCWFLKPISSERKFQPAVIAGITELVKLAEHIGVKLVYEKLGVSRVSTSKHDVV